MVQGEMKEEIEKERKARLAFKERL